jgi:hypothetical protein
VLARAVLLVLVFASSAGAQTATAHKTAKLEEVVAWFRAHQKEVFFLGSEPLFEGMTNLIVEGVLAKRTVARIITGDAGVSRFRPVAQAGGQVRHRPGAFSGQNGFNGSIVLLEGRYALTRRNAEWFLFDSVEGVAQIKSRFELLWAYCQPIPLR